jgi:hypothetical protein
VGGAPTPRRAGAARPRRRLRGTHGGRTFTELWGLD